MDSGLHKESTDVTKAMLILQPKIIASNLRRRIFINYPFLSNPTQCVLCHCCTHFRWKLRARIFRRIREEKFLASNRRDNEIVKGHVVDKRYFDAGGGRRDPLNIKRIDEIIISPCTT